MKPGAMYQAFIPIWVKRYQAHELPLLYWQNDQQAPPSDQWDWSNPIFLVLKSAYVDRNGPFWYALYRSQTLFVSKGLIDRCKLIN